MIATSAVGPLSTAGFAAGSIAWQDLALVVVGVLLLVLAGLVVYRKRHAFDEEADTPIPLIEVPTQAPPGQPRATWPRPPVLEPLGAERATPQYAAVGPVDEWGEQVQAGPVRFHRPPEGTLQLLPGRLEIVSGKEGVDEIRFVKVPGKDPIVTFGRSAGEPHTHIELQSPTVSRKHAAMRFHKGSWHIVNLSKTNPLVVRGRALAMQDAPVRLEDGDQVEMGEVTFRFHSR